jgi:hypothetical protein
VTWLSWGVSPGVVCPCVHTSHGSLCRMLLTKTCRCSQGSGQTPGMWVEPQCFQNHLRVCSRHATNKLGWGPSLEDSLPSALAMWPSTLFLPTVASMRSTPLQFCFTPSTYTASLPLCLGLLKAAEKITSPVSPESR